MKPFDFGFILTAEPALSYPLQVSGLRGRPKSQSRSYQFIKPSLKIYEQPTGQTSPTNQSLSSLLLDPTAH